MVLVKTDAFDVIPRVGLMAAITLVDKTIASKGNAPGNPCCGDVQVNQCYRCHQTDAWNDIKGIGFYKHH